MPKYSIIIPVYNVEKYLKKCLDSVVKQTFKDYEIIIVNDGTKDNSMDIAKDYDATIIYQENQGLSAARNTGVRYAKGEYLIFLDSDDYWEPKLLEEIEKSMDNNPDLVRFQLREVIEDTNEKKDYHEEPFQRKNGVEAFSLICKYHHVEVAWAYAIRKEYYLENKYEFCPGAIHEDFGLIPLVIMKAKRVNSIDYIGYNYLQRKGSIMSNLDYAKTKKKVSDFYRHYLFLTEEIDKTNLDSKTFKSFIANSLVLKISYLKGNDYLEYKKRLEKDKVIDHILADTKTRKMKKILYHISPKLANKMIHI